jgi:hypothetical protein
MLLAKYRCPVFPGLLSQLERLTQIAQGKAAPSHVVYRSQCIGMMLSQFGASL